MLIFDSHLDLGMNALLWNRDLTKPVAEIRRAEAGMTGKGRGMNTVALPELGKGRVAVSVATVLARTGASPAPNLPSYQSAEIAYAMAQGQLAYYRVLASQNKLRVIAKKEELGAHVREWESWDDAHREGETPPPGIILSMEGGDPIVSPEQVASWWQDGLRAIGLAHYQESAYAHGTGSKGGLKSPAGPLLEHMRSLGMILDLTHLADESFWEALKLWDGPVMASHNNCRALVPGERQFSDEQLRAILERGGVIGCALDAWMLYPGWVRGETSPEVVGLEALIDHLDHICELAGNARYAAIGSDLDGGFGKEQTPHDLDTIADLQRLPKMLEGRGYHKEDVKAIMYGNWLRFFLDHLP